MITIMKSFTASFILVSLLALSIGSCSLGFGPDYDKAEIKQNIGGDLICSSVSLQIFIITNMMFHTNIKLLMIVLLILAAELIITENGIRMNN